MVNRVKELNTFFSGKLQIINNKMKTIVNGTPGFIQKNIDDDNKMREWQEWAGSFDNILKHEWFVANSSRGTNIEIGFDIVDFLYNLEEDMNKMVVEVRALTNEKWNKCLNKLNIVKGATYPYEESNITI